MPKPAMLIIGFVNGHVGKGYTSPIHLKQLP